MAKPWMAEFGAGGVLVAAQTVIEPVGMVVGNVVLQRELFGVPAHTSEVIDMSKRDMKGWEMVLACLRERAAELRADGVLSIRLSRRDLEEHKVTEFCVIGTAVRGLPRPGMIWTADLSPEEVALLVGQGYVPVCFAVGCCTWHQSSYPWEPAKIKGFTRPTQEIVPATKALYTARSVAMERVQQEAARQGASGVIGSRIVLTKVHSEGMMVGFLAGCEACGTGIARGHGEFRNGEIMCAVPLND